MIFSRKNCCNFKGIKKETPFFISILIALGTIIFYLIHCVLPVVLPVLLVLNIPLPDHIQHIKIPPVLTLFSICIVLYLLVRKRFIVFWSRKHR